MSNEPYELQVLLELRQQALETAEDDYAKALAKLEQRRRDVAQARKNLVQAQHIRESEVKAFDHVLSSGSFDIKHRNHFEDYVRGLKAHEDELAKAIIRAEQAVKAEERIVANVKDALLQATQDLKAVESHQEQWKQEQRAERARKEEDAMDDVAIRLWRSQR
jgi:flagellar export protein FliJ